MPVRQSMVFVDDNGDTFSEEVTFTLTFGADVGPLALSSIDFGSINGADAATVTIGDNATITISDGFGAEFDDGENVFTPATAFDISSGDTIVFGGTGRYNLQGFTFGEGGGTPPAIPEPTSLAMLGLGGMLMVIRRRR